MLLCGFLIKESWLVLKLRVSYHTEWSNKKYPPSFHLSFRIGRKNARLNISCFLRKHIKEISFNLFLLHNWCDFIIIVLASRQPLQSFILFVLLLFCCFLCLLVCHSCVSYIILLFYLVLIQVVLRKTGQFFNFQVSYHACPRYKFHRNKPKIQKRNWTRSGIHTGGVHSISYKNLVFST